MANKSPTEAPSSSSSGRKSNLVGVRVSEAELRWLEAEGTKREKAGATLQESTVVNIVREMIKSRMTVFHLPADFVEILQADMEEQGLTLEQFVQQRLSDYVVQKKLEGKVKGQKK